MLSVLTLSSVLRIHETKLLWPQLLPSVFCGAIRAKQCRKELGAKALACIHCPPEESIRGPLDPSEPQYYSVSKHTKIGQKKNKYDKREEDHSKDTPQKVMLSIPSNIKNKDGC